MAVRDTPAALLRHVQRVLTSRFHPDRAKRVDLGLHDDLAGRLGPDHVARFEALIGVCLASLEMIGARRERDLMLARGRPDRAQSHGARLCAAEQTIEDLVQVLAAPPGPAVGPHDTPLPGRAGKLKDQADQRARELAPLYAQALARCATDNQVARWLNERQIPACGPGPWNEPRAAALRRRLKKLGLASMALSIRQVRTRVHPQADERLKCALTASIEP